MESISSKTQGKFSKLRKYLSNRILSYLNLDDFTILDEVSKKFNEYFRLNHKKLISNYFLSLNNPDINKENNSSIIYKYKKKFLKKIFIDENFNKFRGGFKEFLVDLLFKSNLFIAAYKNDGGYYRSINRYHYQNLFQLNDEWFCSSLNGKAFDVRAALVTCLDIKIQNHIYSEKINKTNFIGYDTYNSNEKIKIKLKAIKHLLDQFISISYLQPVYKKSKKEKLTFDRTIKTYNTLLEELKNTSSKDELLYRIQKNSFDNSNPCLSFMLDSFFLSNHGWGFTCPVRTFAVFIHDDVELNEADLSLLSNTFNRENILKSFIENKECFSVLQNKRNDDHDQYLNYYEFDTLRQSYYGMNLKLLFWIETSLSSGRSFDLKKFEHFGKYIIVKLINAHRRNDSDDNIDFESLNFYGSTFQ